jgi:O-antigen/teichoic acid export membrane protein
MLPEQAFGLMALVQVFLMGIHLFSDLGIGPSIIQHKDGNSPVFVNTAFTMQAGRGLVLWIICCLGALPFSRFYSEPDLAWMLPLVGLAAIIEGLSSTKLLTANRNLAMGRLTAIELSSQVAGLAIMLTWAHLRPGVGALVAGSLAGAFLRTVMGHVLLPGPANRLAWDPIARRNLLHFGRWIFISTVLTFLAGQSDRLIFGKLVDIQRLGVLAIAMNLASLPSQALQTLMSKIVFPLFSHVHNDAGDFVATFRRIRWKILVLGGWSLSGLLAGGPSAVRLLYDNRYADAGWMLQIVVAGAWFGTLLENSNGVALLARGLARWTAAGCAGKLVGMIIAIPLGYLLGGFPGALAGSAIAELLRYAISSYAIARQKLRSLDQDLILTATVAASSLIGWLAARAARVEGAPRVVEAAVVFVVVSAIWAPLAWPLLRRKRAEVSR